MESDQDSQIVEARQSSASKDEQENDIQDSDTEEEEIHEEIGQSSLPPGKRSSAQRRFILDNFQNDNSFTVRSIYTKAMVVAVNSLQGFLDNFGTKLKSWSDRIVVILLDYEGIQAQNRLLQVKVDKYNARANDCDIRIGEVLTDQGRLRQLRDRYRIKAKEFSQQNSVLQDEVQRLSEQATQTKDLSQQNSILQDEVQRLSEQATHAKDLSQQNEALQNKIRSMSEEAASTQDLVTSLQSEIQSLSGQVKEAEYPNQHDENLQDEVQSVLSQQAESLEDDLEDDLEESERGSDVSDIVEDSGNMREVTGMKGPAPNWLYLPKFQGAGENPEETLSEFLDRFFLIIGPSRLSEAEKISKLQQSLDPKLQAKLPFTEGTVYPSFAQFIVMCKQCDFDMRQAGRLDKRGRNRSRETESDGDTSKESPRGSSIGYSNPDLNRQQGWVSRGSPRESSEDPSMRSRRVMYTNEEAMDGQYTNTSTFSPTSFTSSALPAAFASSSPLDTFAPFASSPAAFAPSSPFNSSFMDGSPCDGR